VGDEDGRDTEVVLQLLQERPGLQAQPGAERREKAADTAAGLSLGSYLERRPAQLSGGQQQRVALATIVRSRMVLPQPDGPSSAKNSPSAISSERSSSARTSPS
jgi:ABC-type thiamine transport system ATPase subunit